MLSFILLAYYAVVDKLLNNLLCLLGMEGLLKAMQCCFVIPHELHHVWHVVCPVGLGMLVGCALFL
jgi:hypothetical protein